MKGLFFRVCVLALSVFLLLCGCTTKKENKTPHKVSNTAESKTSSLKYTVFSHYNDITKPCNNYFFETHKYIFYRNNADNGFLYRIDKETKKKTVVFNENSHFFLNNIKATDNEVYFATTIGYDDTPTLYKTDINGNNLKRLIENVGEYVISSDSIYYIENEMTSNSYIHKYSIAEGKDTVIYEKASSGLNLVGQSLYFLSEDSIIKLNLNNYKATKTQVPQTCYSSKLFCYNNSAYFKSMIKTDDNKETEAIICYDFKTSKTKTIANISLFKDYTEKYSDATIDQFIINPDGSVYISLWCISEISLNTLRNSQKIFHLRNGKAELCIESNESGVLFHCDGELLLFNPNNSSDALIEGNDKYNEVVS